MCHIIREKLLRRDKTFSGRLLRLDIRGIHNTYALTQFIEGEDRGGNCIWQLAWQLPVMSHRNDDEDLLIGEIRGNLLCPLKKKCFESARVINVRLKKAIIDRERKSRFCEL